jgi:nitric oxide reductase subunit B
LSGPIISGKEPKYQRLGVNVLFGALLVVVLWVDGRAVAVGDEHAEGRRVVLVRTSGLRILDLGRVWQAALLVGLLLWLFLIARTAVPALKEKGDQRSLISL